MPEVLSGALEHIEERGSLLGFTPDRTQRLGLMKLMSEQGLVVWDKAGAKYELTTFGRQCLAECRQKIAEEPAWTLRMVGSAAN